MNEEDKITFQNMREVINKQSKAIKQLVDANKKLTSKVELNKQRIAGIILKMDTKKKSPFDGLF